MTALTLNTQTKERQMTIIRENNYSIVSYNDKLLGKCYAVVNHKHKTAKNGLTLQAAFDLFKKVTLDQILNNIK